MYKVLGWLNVGVIIALAALGFAHKADAKELEQHSRLLAQYVLWCKTNSWILVPALSASLLVVKGTRDHVGAPWVRDAIHSILTVLGEVVFAGEDNPEAAYDRVTLFRRKAWHFSLRSLPWGGWLVPVVRSGHTSQKMNAVFRAPDQPSKVQGIGGYCWANQKQVEVNGLPKLTSASSPEDFSAYAAASHMPVEWVHENLPQARSYFAFPVKVRGRPWGAVVIDSRLERIVGTRLKTVTSIVGTALSELAEKSGR